MMTELPGGSKEAYITYRAQKLYAMKGSENNSYSKEKKMHRNMLRYLEYGAWRKKTRKIRH